MDTVRRVRAARGSLNLSLTEFAKAIGVGRQTLVRIESGVREPKPHEYAAMAEATGLPVEFFTAPDLREALAGADAQPTLQQRVDDLADDLADLKKTLAADALRRAASERERAADRRPVGHSRAGREGAGR